MSRELNEGAAQFIQRIEANVGKVVNKKKKKGVEEIKVEVQFLLDDGQLDLGRELIIFNIYAIHSPTKTLAVKLELWETG